MKLNASDIMQEAKSEQFDLSKIQAYIARSKFKTFEIKDCADQSIIYETEAASLKKAVEQAVREKVNLRFADLRGANLRGANLRRAKLYRVILHRAKLQAVNLQKAYLREAYMPYADLRGADLREADLRGADLHGANLHGANLQYAYLYGANLSAANLRKAKFSMPREELFRIVFNFNYATLDNTTKFNVLLNEAKEIDLDDIEWGYYEELTPEEVKYIYDTTELLAPIDEKEKIEGVITHYDDLSLRQKAEAMEEITYVINNYSNNKKSINILIDYLTKDHDWIGVDSNSINTMYKIFLELRNRNKNIKNETITMLKLSDLLINEAQATSHPRPPTIGIRVEEGDLSEIRKFLMKDAPNINNNDNMIILVGNLLEKIKQGESGNKKTVQLTMKELEYINSVLKKFTTEGSDVLANKLHQQNPYE